MKTCDGARHHGMHALQNIILLFCPEHLCLCDKPCVLATKPAARSLCNPD